MPAANVPLDIDQGEDWSAHIVWTDSYNEPIPVIHPCRMDIRDSIGTVIHSLETDPDVPEGTIPGLALSTETGLIQMHMDSEVTAAMNPGVYFYDLFVSTDDGAVYAGNQISRLLYGKVSVNKRTTVL